MAAWLGIAAMTLLAQAVPELRTTARLVVAPVTVTGASGKPVHGLTKEDFHLFDNGTRREFDVELLEERVSLVVVLQTSLPAVAALEKLKKASSMFAPVVAGERGSVAVVTFSDSARVHQEFTRRPEIASLRAYGYGTRALDAVSEGLRLLETRPKSHRRVILLVSDAKDRGSETKLDHVLKRAQAAGVTIFALTFSAAATQFTSRDVPVSGSDSVHGGISVFAVLKALGDLGKEDTALALARETGGTRLKFTKQEALEDAIAKIGEEIHTQYLLAFQPRSSPLEEYRLIRVELANRTGLHVRTRPGYWIQPELQPEP
jgi:VWFA-related protein